MKRTQYCGQLRKSDIGKKVVLCGWMHSRRDHGGVIFIDIRDRYGIAQLVFNPENKGAFDIADKLRSEYVIAATGKVRPRPEGTVNPNLPTGEVEIVVETIELLNTSKSVPFEVSDFTKASEDVRLKYRYLDLRRPELQKNLILRNNVMVATREFLVQEGFLEIETPFLTKSTPEGARDYLVPSRITHGSFYALPQSPQLFKQILMVAGFDKYFQIVRCFRDEDLRSDRQPEFTQIDLEMSFIDENDVMSVIERMVAAVFKKVLSVEVPVPFKRIACAEAMEKYGSDKPDLRFGLPIIDLTQELKSCGFNVFSEAANRRKGIIRALKIDGGAQFSRLEIDEFTKYVNTFGAKGLAWMKVTDKGLESSITKFFKSEKLSIIQQKTNAAQGDIIFFGADDEHIVCSALGNLRLLIAKKLQLIPQNIFNFSWIVDFPLFTWSPSDGRYVSNHHPFTSPCEEFIPLLSQKSTELKAFHTQSQEMDCVKAKAYDLVLNGTELGGGSIRIHGKDIQEKIFSLLGIGAEEARVRFGFLLDALEYGAPPHGGIALGLDRMVALMLGTDSIRDAIAFPKTQKAVCPMTNAPDTVDQKQLKELGIKIL